MTTEQLVKELQEKLQQAIAERERYLAQAERADTLARSLRIVIDSYDEPQPALLVSSGQETGGAPVGVVRSVAQGPAVRHSPVVEQIERVLISEGRPMHFQAVWSRLRERGVTITGKSPANNVNAHMSRRKDLFENVGRGLWALTRWTAEQKGISPIMPTMMNNEALPLYEGGWQTTTPLPPLPELESPSTLEASPESGQSPDDQADLDDVPY